MNQCLENPASPEVLPFEDAPAPGCAVGEPAATDAVAAKNGRVLLLDDDPSFREIIRDFLTEGGYTVTAVKSGVEGIREVLAGDFAVILCDMMMPGLPGDMFYRAVERTRPHLCERFVFMSGHRGDAKANDFIKSVHGYVLRKPFHLKDLADSISFAEVRATYASVVESATTDPVDASAQARVAAELRNVPSDCGPGLSVNSFDASQDAPLSDGRKHSPKEPLRRHEAGHAYLARAKHEDQRPSAMRAEESRESAAEPEKETGTGLENTTGQRPPEPRGRDRRSARLLLATLALSAVVAGTLGTWYVKLSKRYESLSVEASRLNREWAGFSGGLDDARRVKRLYQATVDQVTRLEKERETPSWVPALRSITTCAGPGIQVREVRGREASGDAKAWQLKVGGGSTGAVPRTVADDFRLTLQRHLEQSFPGSVSTKFEQLDDLPDAIPVRPGERRGIFTIIATIDFAGKAQAEVK